jgi:hypothetical protein
MNRITQQAAAALCAILTACSLTDPSDTDEWHSVSTAKVFVEYKTPDAELAPSLLRWATTGTTTVESALGLIIAQPFAVRIHTDRTSLQTEWSARFGTPPGGFQCWMIANADVNGVVMLSPRAFATDSCGHNAQDTVETRAILGHEVTHLIHRRINPSNQLGGGGTGWFYEGVAVFSSGQLNTARRNQARTALQTAPPTQLARILDTDAGYSLAGSLVGYIAQQYGISKVRDLMYLVTQAEILGALGLSEASLITDWRAYVLSR